MSNVNEVVNSYIAAWNERDPRARRELIAKTWTEDGSYIDPHRNGDSYDGISKMIAAVHEVFDLNYRFRLKSGVEAYATGSASSGKPAAPRTRRYISSAPISR
jgi:hypothetical protein